MPASMTAFATRDRELNAGTLTWELRGVNHRYREVQPRLPEVLRALEPAVRERVGAAVGRGRVECTLRFQPTRQPDGLELDHDAVRALVDACHTIDEYVSRPARLSSLELLQWPGIVRSGEPGREVLREPAFELLEATLQDFTASRAREGERLQSVLLARCDAIERLVVQEREHVATITQRLRERLQQRLASIDVDYDPARLEQELAYQAQRLDVSEELDRLDAHVAAVRSALTQDEPVGRRLDFLMQELNREANTLGSKAADADRAETGVELKVLIEQMREQIQNLE
ncbi:MAG: YicC family protein [Proteobacteria bacterium SW_6_67_9]|nr:MAG: YicC family protein [Proteobacteria bacterium SW_6_67_9]